MASLCGRTSSCRSTQESRRYLFHSPCNGFPGKRYRRGFANEELPVLRMSGILYVFVGITSCSHREALGTESTPLFFSVIGVDFEMNTVWRPRRDLNPCYRRESGYGAKLQALATWCKIRESPINAWGWRELERCNVCPDFPSFGIGLVTTASPELAGLCVSSLR